MNYLAILYQDNGCDYTIGCGYLPHKFKADNMKDAEEALKLWCEKEHNIENIDNIVLFEVSDESSIPVGRWRQEKINFLQRELDYEKEQEEKREYERLKKKFK